MKIRVECVELDTFGTVWWCILNEKGECLWRTDLEWRMRSGYSENGYDMAKAPGWQRTRNECRRIVRQYKARHPELTIIGGLH